MDIENFFNGFTQDTRLAVVFGAGDVGYPLAKELLDRGEGWRVIVTRRTNEQLTELGKVIRQQGVDPSSILGYALDPASELDLEGFAHMLLINHRFVDLMILASGKAILDTSYQGNAAQRNILANFSSKQAAYASLHCFRAVNPNSIVVVISSKVMDFPKDAPEIETQRHYRASIEELEKWAIAESENAHCLSKFFIFRVPLVAGATATEYRESGVVPESLEPLDPYLYARAELNRIFGHV